MSTTSHVLVSRQRGHRLHLTLTVLTMGAWGVFVWLPLALVRRARGPKRAATIVTG